MTATSPRVPETFLWGGDLNTDPGMDDIRGFTGGNRRMFEIYRQSGSRDTRTRFFDTPQRTYFKDGNRHYQLDHVFARALVLLGLRASGGLHAVEFALNAFKPLQNQVGDSFVAHLDLVSLLPLRRNIIVIVQPGCAEIAVVTVGSACG